MTLFQISRERCGFGRDAGPPPSLRLGVLRLSWWKGGYEAVMKKTQAALVKAREELRR